MKSVVIGGGVSGLAAGIYARKCGFECELHEKNPNLGGMCSYWMRKGYLLDNCVHWLTGTNPSTDMYSVWEELGVLGQGVDIVQHESFLQLSHEGQTLAVWRDAERLRRDMKAISPEDSKAIDHFITTLNRYRNVVLPTVPNELMTPAYIVRMLWKMRSILLINKRYATMSISHYAERFRHPLLRKLCTCYLPSTYSAMAMFYTYATFCNGNGDLPAGGSKGIIDRMEALYRSLGGKVITSHEASRIVMDGNRAVGVEFTDGTSVSADWVVPACDTYETLTRLLPDAMNDDYFAPKYADRKNYSIYNSLNCYFALDGRASDSMEHNTIVLDGSVDVLGNVKSTFIMKNFDYEPGFAPEGHSVIQVMADLTDVDFDHWKALYDSDRASYKYRKNEVATRICECVEARFPLMKGRLTLLDVATPVTHQRWCNAYKGAYMTFVLGPTVKKGMHSGRLKGIDNLVLAGQWLQMPGGMPNAAVTGKFAIQRICKSMRACVRP